MEGGGAGQGARRTGTAATPAAHPRAHKQNALGKLPAKLGGLVSLFPPSAPTFFSEADSGSPVRPAASCPTLLPQGRALAVRLSSQDLKGGESGSPAEASPAPAGQRRRLPLPRGRGAGRSLSAAGPLPKPAHSPCPIAQPRAREPAATSAGLPPRSGDETAASEREGQPAGERNGAGVGEDRVGISFPQGVGCLGSG